MIILKFPIKEMWIWSQKFCHISETNNVHKGPVCNIKEDLSAEFEYNFYVFICIESLDNRNGCVFITEFAILHYNVSTLAQNGQTKQWV